MLGRCYRCDQDQVLWKDSGWCWTPFCGRKGNKPKIIIAITSTKDIKWIQASTHFDQNGDNTDYDEPTNLHNLVRGHFGKKLKGSRYTTGCAAIKEELFFAPFGARKKLG